MLYGGMGGIEQQVGGPVGLQPYPATQVAAPQVAAPQVAAPQYGGMGGISQVIQRQITIPAKTIPQVAAPQVAAPQVAAPQYGGMGGISQVIQRQITMPAKTITIKTPQSAALFPSGFTTASKSTTVIHNFTPTQFNAIPTMQLSNPTRQKTMNNLQLIIAKLQKSLGIGA